MTNIGIARWVVTPSAGESLVRWRFAGLQELSSLTADGVPPRVAPVPEKIRTRRSKDGYLWSSLGSIATLRIVSTNARKLSVVAPHRSKGRQHHVHSTRDRDSGGRQDLVPR